MPKKLAVHFECERCPRSWFEDYEEGQPMPESTEFAATLSYPLEQNCMEISFEVLCTSCVQTVRNLFDSINKTDKKSPQRGAKKEDSEESPEIDTTSTDTS
jgi:hypothetical protein